MFSYIVLHVDQNTIDETAVTLFYHLLNPRSKAKLLIEIPESEVKFINCHQINIYMHSCNIILDGRRAGDHTC